MRLSGRLPSHYRPFHLKFHAPYHLLLSLGETIITARLIAKVEKVPHSASKSAQSQGQFKLQVQEHSQRKRELERLVDRILKGSKALDLEELCIIVGQWVWNIEMNVRIVNQGGNEIDAVVLAVIALLLRFRRPQVDIQVGQKSKFDSDDQMFISNDEKVRELLEREEHSTLRQSVQILDGTERDPIPLSIHHVPLTVTFALYTASDDSNRILYLIDPDYEEQVNAEGLITVAVNTHGEICSLEKSGGVALSPQCIIQCVKMATVKIQELSKALVEVVEKDIQRSEKARKLQYEAYNNPELALQADPTQDGADNMTDSDVSDISDVEEEELILPSQNDITQHQQEMLRRMTAPDNDNPTTAVVEDGAKESPIVPDDIDDESDESDSEHTTTLSNGAKTRSKKISLKEKTKESGMSGTDLS
eukprot:CAMPEP_0117442180 /NCGR_PEP_ID=MMETSP0759-20121206/4017_1 /TAXON_ID=63605 /ORGANISM="Percolomonas cosmopolitus, Strain WS" /LENGTH=419 /DNA_ID=CAMNT_0005234057 /DNA_START=101 /DNA_END=1357 /DNA_ORIENTATION=+